MQIVCHELSLAAFIEAKQPPSRLVPRKGAQRWHAAISPLTLRGAVTWSLVRTGDHVGVPLFAHRLSGAPHLALGYAAGVAANAALQLPAAVAELHFFVGSPVLVSAAPTDTSPGALCVFFGCAALEE